MKEDWIHILEAAYDLVGDDGQWLQRVAEATRPSLDHGRGIVAYFFDASSPHPRFFGYCGAGTDDAAIEVARRTHEIPIWQSSEFLRATYRRPSALVDSGASLGRKRVKEFLRLCGYSGEDGPFQRVMLLHAADPSHRGCVLGAPDPGVSSDASRRRASWSRVAAHVAAGLRLRRRLGEREDAEGAEEAILSPAGEVLHAEGPAKQRPARDALRTATLSVDKARGPVRRSDPDAALKLWRGLLDGRWSLIDRFDTDGKRLIVAHRNDVATRGFRSLTLRERQVVAYAALAHPNKLIAYELGLSLGSVGTHLSSALVKLGAKSRVELVELASSLGAGKLRAPTAEYPKKR